MKKLLQICTILTVLVILSCSNDRMDILSQKATNSITVEISTSQQVIVTVYDFNYNLVKTLHDGYLSSGSHSMYWNGKDLYDNSMPSGVYNAKIETETNTITQEIIMVR